MHKRLALNTIKTKYVILLAFLKYYHITLQEQNEYTNFKYRLCHYCRDYFTTSGNGIIKFKLYNFKSLPESEGFFFE